MLVLPLLLRYASIMKKSASSSGEKHSASDDENRRERFIGVGKVTVGGPDDAGKMAPVLGIA